MSKVAAPPGACSAVTARIAVKRSEEDFRTEVKFE
jgi:hypothetical protein